MSNVGYLCASNHKGAFPSGKAKGFDPAKNTVACDVSTVPLLWLALFRPKDIKNARSDGATYIAPLAETIHALRQLEDAVPLLDQVLASEGPFGAHAAALANELRLMNFKYVTLELAELEAQEDRGVFAKKVRRALAFFENPEAERKAMEARLAAEAKLSEVEKIQRVRARCEVSIQDARRLLAERGSVSAAIAEWRRRLTDLERARDEYPSLFSRKEEPGTIRELLLELCGIKPGVRVVAPTRQAVESDTRGDGAVNLVRVLGARHERPLPWD